ncbi:receptor-type tyrosine-protein phosphatase N2 isoform X5 [Pieris rapae]|uniref:receptor-type tyrosine-protein phosphatase N2 isoform X5 n=1 Tax=Pieris rapae TaxID=64459 RepID=UPI001E27C241|nr:receptor-type tyrosine-protein phosphatase N2 isoform X5 [Pieris rapae]
MVLMNLRLSVWALALLSVLAPSIADGNIGCLFSSTLCVEGVEWCFDDFAFGKCIPIYESDVEEGSLYQYDMSSGQLQWFEGELQRLATQGYRWEHAYTQCILQSMLYALRQRLDPANVNAKLCDQFADPKLNSAPISDGDEMSEIVEPDETAYIRFTPNSPLGDSDYANEVFNPPLTPDNEPIPYLSEDNLDLGVPSDKVRDLILMNGVEDSPVVPFQGFRERLRTETLENPDLIEKEKKSLKPKLEPNTETNEFTDEQRLGAHFRKYKTKPPPYTAEYLTGNRFLDAEVHSNALEKYRQSFAAKQFPFEYENPEDMPESRIYFEDGTEDELLDAGSGDLGPYNSNGGKSKSKYDKNNMAYLMNYWREIIGSKLKPQDAIAAEGGPLGPDELQENEAAGKADNHNEYQYDPSYAFVKFQNSVDPTEVTFKVEKNNRGWDAEEVARQIGSIKEKVRKETGAQIVASGIGDRTQYHVMRQDMTREPQYFGLELPVLLALVGSLAVLIAGIVVFAVLLKRDMSSKRKMQGLSSAAEIDAEATRDYQVELCRARMSGKMTGQNTAAHPTDAPQRITSLSREPDGNSPSTRSSTSSWSEEPALTNMDISTGHMVLAYMEDHLRNKDRLEQEWKALVAYEAEPNTTTAAVKPDNNGKNRYPLCLPYDHSRVTLNPLSNHLGSDYINASTITDHDPRNPAYIAASGPMPHTSSDFWQMVWEQGSVVMVMLTRLTENGQQLCHRYWPEEGSELYHIYEVHLVSEHIWCDDYLVRSFYLKNQRTSETRTVTQFHFLSWPENGVPSSTKALLEFRRKVNKSYRGRSCPIVVHCSDGAGRSGTYCLIDMVLNRMAKGAKEIDIAATLEHIRDQRPRMVATKQQFEFVLMAVAEEVHAILKALPAHLQQLQEKKDKEKDKDGSEKEKHN